MGRIVAPAWPPSTGTSTCTAHPSHRHKDELANDGSRVLLNVRPHVATPFAVDIDSGTANVDQVAHEGTTRWLWARSCTCGRQRTKNLIVSLASPPPPIAHEAHHGWILAQDLGDKRAGADDIQRGDPKEGLWVEAASSLEHFRSDRHGAVHRVRDDRHPCRRTCLRTLSVQNLVLCGSGAAVISMQGVNHQNKVVQ